MQSKQQSPKQQKQQQRVPSPAAGMNLQVSGAGPLRLAGVKAPSSIPGLRPMHEAEPQMRSVSQQSTPSSDESNSPTELNSLSQSSSADTAEFKSKRISQISSCSSGSCPAPPPEGGTPTPPPLPERSDSLNNRCEEGELRAAPWEITLEVLGQEPVGAFMVRESTSKPGCYALSLRVPRDFQPSGIAHYLIMRTNKGYKIKTEVES
ncbi:Tensin-3 [Gryllus bimaculatus]|nr:Tensin-3 [Gryllus bimaculatus]